MRFLMLVKADERSEAGVLPDEQLLSEMGKFNAELASSGAMLAGDGLQASSKGARVRAADGKTRVIDGPFAEAKELVAGYWMVQVKSRADAIEWAKRVPFADGQVELRQLYEIEDFPVDAAEQPDGWREKEQQLREATPSSAARDARKPGVRYMLLLKANRPSESGQLPDEKLLSAMGAYIEELTNSGVLLGGEGLMPSSAGARVDYTGSERTVVDGPFTESKELIAGYLILQVSSRAEAIDWARRWLEIHVQGPAGGAGEIEVRQLFELEDFPVDAAEQPGGWRDQEQRARERMATAARG